MKKAIGIVAILLAIGLVLTVTIQHGSSEAKPDLSLFAQCITDSGMKMAGSDRCSFCQMQKSMFGQAFEEIEYIDCDSDREWCRENNVMALPTWILSDGTRMTGVQSFEALSDLSGCEYYKSTCDPKTPGTSYDNPDGFDCGGVDG